MSKAQLREVAFPLLVKQSLHVIHQLGREREAPIVSISSMMKHVGPSNSVFVHSSTPTTTSFASNGERKECTFFVPLLASNLNFYPYFIQTYHGIAMESRNQRH